MILAGVDALQVAVDGRQIAFTSSRDGNAEIYVMNADGGKPRNLTNHPDGDANPAWSPDGKRIVFMSDRDGHVNIHGILRIMKST